MLAILRHSLQDVGPFFGISLQLSCNIVLRRPSPLCLLKLSFPKIAVSEFSGTDNFVIIENYRMSRMIVAKIKELVGDRRRR